MSLVRGASVAFLVGVATVLVGRSPLLAQPRLGAPPSSSSSNRGAANSSASASASASARPTSSAAASASQTNEPAAPSASAAPSATASAAPEKSWSSCVEYVPEGAIRPKLEAHFPPNGTSGYELRLLVTVTHGRGETVLPAGFRIDRGSDSVRALEAAGFRIPETTGGSPPVLDRPKDADLEDVEKRTLTTSLSLPFIALPEKPGRHALRLPQLPIAVGRANGQVMTVCTPAMAITIEDPIANESQPKVHDNAPPRSQREEWALAKQATYAALAGLALAAFGAWLATRWNRRPKPLPTAPRVPPWVTALEELAAIRASRLVEDGQLDVYVDRVNDCVRRYLGDRFGFDGLESTTEEIRLLLKRIDAHVVDRTAVEAFLDDSDLVKFAKFAPGPEDCALMLSRAETIVRSTIPPRKNRAEESA